METKAKPLDYDWKLMATDFWDSQGVMYTDYLEKGKTVTRLYYTELLGRFDTFKSLFKSNEVVITATEAYYADLRKTFFLSELKSSIKKETRLRNKSLVQNFRFSFVG